MVLYFLILSYVHTQVPFHLSYPSLAPSQWDQCANIVLAKKFIQIFLLHLTEKPGELLASNLLYNFVSTELI